MKNKYKALLLLIVSTVIISSCGSMRTASGPASPSRSSFVGTWTLNNVSYTNLVEGAVQTVFDQAPPKDFIGSTWELTNSGNGSYTLANGAKQDIFWSVNAGDALGPIFQFKKLNQGQAAKNVTTGYQMVISNNTGTSMTLKTLIFMGGKNGYVVYTFSKIK